MNQVYQSGQDGQFQPGAYGNQRHVRNAHSPQAAFGQSQPNHPAPQQYLQPAPQMAPRQGMAPGPVQQYRPQQGGQGQYQPQQRPSQQPQPQGRIMPLASGHFQTKDTVHGKMLIMPNITEPTFVLFHTDSCGVCTQVMPIYHQISQQIPYRFATCNLSKNVEVLNMSEGTVSPIDYVPRLYLYSKGWPYIVYKDTWQPEKLLQFMHVSWKTAVDSNQQSQPPSQSRPQQRPPQQQQQQYNPQQTHQPQYTQQAYNPNPQAHEQYNPQHPNLPQLPRKGGGRITAVEHQLNNQPSAPSQYAPVGSDGDPQAPTQDGDQSGELISFNEVLCQGSHGCYTVTDLPAS